MEALVRWNNPEMGLLLPNSFIPLCEENKTIIPLGEWVIGAAFEQYSKWMEKDKFILSINLSVVQLVDEKLYSHILCTSKKYESSSLCI